MLALGTACPPFTLPDVVSGRTVSPSDFRSHDALLVMFICNHCPFVKHIRAQLAALARDYAKSSLGIVAINSNDVEKYPDDAPPKMVLEARDAGYVFPYCFDETQAVAKAFAAACTPDFYLFDKARKLFYRGQLDDSRPVTRTGGNNLPVTGKDLRAAIDAVLAGRPAPQAQRPSIGCNIKWKPGNEPVYFGVSAKA